MFSNINDGKWNMILEIKEGNGTVILIPGEGSKLTTPVRFTGALGELDAKLPEMLATTMAARSSLEEQMASQKAALDAEAKAKAASKTAAKPATGSKTTPNPAPAKASSETAKEADNFDLFGE
ncbi:PRTRC system protein E [Acidithiobacillus sp.]|uniref:PRTRC system protein E n=1 Tax=Acidithiobacillus sp. TaxID=1872118 RepID=UPI0026390242|nr:PRTRC system protein E [Acidithiobacillus sp.]MDD5278694.1 PRTRC system protein E [Acidithiobacillus sp.]